MSQPLSMLFIDDDERLRERFGSAFPERGLHMLLADGHAAAVVLANARSIDRAHIDPRMPGPHKLAVIQDLVALHPEIEIVVLAGCGSVASAVEAMQLGARNFRSSPTNAKRILVAFETYPAPVQDTECDIPGLSEPDALISSAS